MHNTFENFPKLKRHLYSFLLSVCCMAAAAGISLLYRRCMPKPVCANIVMIFLFFVIVVSGLVNNCLYGIACSVFSLLWLRFLFPPRSGYPVMFFGIIPISVFVNTLTSHLTAQAGMIAEHRRQLEEAEKEKMRANLLRAVSHDLRTPLTAIIGSSTAYLENQSQLSEQEKTAIVKNICKDSHWMVNMVENLLTVTRIQGEDLTVSTDIESVEEVIGEALQKTKIRHPGCIIHTKIPDQFIMLPMDAVLIEQVTLNLLDNALRHSESLAPIELIVEDAPKYVFFTVRDYGRGIPEDILDRLFDGSGRAAPSSDAQGNRGIGLVICETIIRAHHGTLTGHNHGKGAEFTFTLPKEKKESFL